MDATQAPSPAPDPAVCEAVTRSLGRFVTGDITADEKRLLREHVLVCESCRTTYRSTVASAANLGRRVRLDREEHARRERHESLRRSALQATGSPHRGRRFGLRLALLPAGIALLMILWRARGYEEPLVAEWRAGEPNVAGAALGEDPGRYLLSIGDWCETGATGELFLHAAGEGTGAPFELTLYPEGQLQVEDVEAHRLRLQQGRVSVRGTATITSSSGVLSLEDAAATLDLAGPGFVVECFEGSVGWFGPAGERRLAAGEVLRASRMLADVR